MAVWRLCRLWDFRYKGWERLLSISYFRKVAGRSFCTIYGFNADIYPIRTQDPENASWRSFRGKAADDHSFELA